LAGQNIFRKVDTASGREKVSGKRRGRHKRLAHLFKNSKKKCLELTHTTKKKKMSHTKSLWKKYILKMQTSKKSQGGKTYSAFAYTKGPKNASHRSHKEKKGHQGGFCEHHKKTWGEKNTLSMTG